jgi:hypothetical protein
MVVLPLTCAQSAWGQGQNQVNVDSLLAAARAGQELSLKPTFTGTSKAGVTAVSLGGRYRQTFDMTRGVRLVTMLSTNRQDFRQQARSNENKLFSNLLTQEMGLGWRLEFSHMNNKTFNRVIAATGGFQDVIVNTLTLSAGLKHVTIGRNNFRWDGRAMAVLGDAEKTFKTDKSQGGEVGGGFRYRLFSDKVSVKGRRYHKTLSVDSNSSLEEFHGLPVFEDSISGEVAVHFNGQQTVRVTYDDFEANEQFTDQERTSTGSQKQGAENLFGEHRTVKSRLTGVGFNSTMLGGMLLRVDASHGDNYTHYRMTPTRFSHNITDNLKGEIRYTLFTGTAVTANLEVNKSDRDLGPQSASSHRRNTRDLKVNVRHAFDNDTYIDILGSTMLIQTFYDPKKNQRDNDQLEQRLNVRMNSRLFSKVTATIGGTYVRTDFINIDPTLSSSNRAKTKLDLRPTITYKMNDRISLTQTYGLAVEFTEYDYERDASEDNFLDRNATFSNDVEAHLTSKLRTNFSYKYYYHDRGSYLRPDNDDDGFPDSVGVQSFDVERKDRRDEIEIRFRYEINGHLSVIGEQTYSRREDRRVGSPNVNVTEKGGIDLGMMGTYKWSETRRLQMRMLKAKRFSPFVTEAQKDYWIVDAELSYAF